MKHSLSAAITAAAGITMAAAICLGMPCPALGGDCYDYRRTRDPKKEKVIIDPALNSDFFTTRSSSYPWYIIRNEDGTFESALGQPITAKDRIPIEHTSSCVSTHQGEHVMSFCSAAVTKAGALELEIEGGLPAYTGSLLVAVRDGHFNCYFKAVYPVLDSECPEWEIVSKQLKLKRDGTGRGKRLYGWISVVFNEITKEQGTVRKRKHRIEGYIKPVVQ